MRTKTAILFPAFITEYTQKEIETLSRNKIDFNKYIQQASETLGIDLPAFSYNSAEYRNDELLAQVIAYLFSCAGFDLIKKNRVNIDFGAGYSMGIYSGLYAANSICLTDGIKIIYKAFELVSELSCTGEYAMAGIIGLTIDDINGIIKNKNFEIEIINVNSEHSLVIAGKKADVLRMIDFAKIEGALAVTALNVKTPYHSEYLKTFANRFSDFVNTLDIKDTEFPIISTFDQRLISTSAEIRKELVYNLTEKINWYKTMQTLIKNDVSLFYECGAGKDLSKIARFIDGDFKVIQMHAI
ncbi:MAG: hypothetical protein A2X13_03800 [Bacteroidetes bacterium GWC2_33_15]|nr:MAG: hypothetical protein A2X10_02440 [Bacteroidetes bacterium GWA2_33_15]OFX49649.1 MAG: hypothetical protein A2X13_03800 [Bacteroidetes bacterium GWC2_33_15]OFX65961.1 MAG: hypothetical protein A2X15_11035 [Bacteroidetes bacterium GWB2_32_14]OFX68278.1 MAG: hypothetical protein A2X14_07860 [Bacteroidetes bacterium GWD2_33_33]HAN18059.1 hypothetical protein [Bacteroidales bacterium]